MSPSRTMLKRRGAQGASLFDALIQRDRWSSSSCGSNGVLSIVVDVTADLMEVRRDSKPLHHHPHGFMSDCPKGILQVYPDDCCIFVAAFAVFHYASQYEGVLRAALEGQEALLGLTDSFVHDSPVG